MRNPLICRKFRRLAQEARDRSLTPAEGAFLEHHARSCPPCREYERQTRDSLSALSGLGFLAEPSPSRFTRSVLRRYRLQTARESLRYWSPALLAAAVAASLVLAALQIATANRASEPFRPGTSQARRITNEPVLPDLTTTNQAAQTQ
ncbi:MAG: zf-HC2 domain-containing protein [Fimbriimonadales bacterium]